MMGQNPILIYTGADICYNILNVFAKEFGNALSDLGEEVIYYDVEKDGLPGLTEFVGRDFKAIVGFQTYAFDPYLPSRQQFLHDLIGGPKFNFQFDHPVWMRSHYEKAPKNLYVLTHDRNYITFIRRYYPAVTDALLLPPGGVLKEQGITSEKSYDLVFVGTYQDYRSYFPMIRKSPKDGRYLANAFLLEMKKHPERTAEDALLAVLAKRGRTLSDGEFLDTLDRMKQIIYCIMSYYREKVVGQILDAGIIVDVYGESWKNSPFVEYQNLHIHPAVSPEDCLVELAKAKLSLNIMAWHKDGFTERIANSMLQKSVVVSDISTCLNEQYRDGEEMVLFDLKKMDALPERIKELLSDDAARERIAENACQRAIREDTWKQRAELFLAYLGS